MSNQVVKQLIIAGQKFNDLKVCINKNFEKKKLTNCCSVVSCVNTEHMSPKFEAQTYDDDDDDKIKRKLKSML